MVTTHTNAPLWGNTLPLRHLIVLGFLLESGGLRNSEDFVALGSCWNSRTMKSSCVPFALFCVGLYPVPSANNRHRACLRIEGGTLPNVHHPKSPHGQGGMPANFRFELSLELCFLIEFDRFWTPFWSPGAQKIRFWEVLGLLGR